MVDREALEREARRVYLRYASEVIEALGFCPWARTAREEGRVAVRVLFGQAPDVGEAADAVLAADADAGTDVTLLVFPECQLERVAFRHFAAEVRTRYDEARGRGETALAIADFHPDAEADVSSPERLVPFVRRSPDPTFQLVRHSALEEARRGDGEGTRFMDLGSENGLRAIAALQSGSSPAPRDEPVHERVARANLRTVARLGVPAVGARLEDIARDRDASYARLGVPASPWALRRNACDER